MDKKERLEHSEMLEGRVDHKSTAQEMRKKRVPMREQNVLDYFNCEPGFKYYWVVDRGNEIPAHKAAGWEFVKGRNSDTYSGDARIAEAQKSGFICRRVNHNTGNDTIGTHAYLMRIPLDIFEEDMKYQQDKVLEKEKEIDPSGRIHRGRPVF